MQTLKEKRALGLKYPVRIVMLSMNMTLIIFFMNLVQWMVKIFSGSTNMEYMDVVLTYHVYFEEQVKGIGDFMIMIGCIPIMALVIMMYVFLFQPLKARQKEEMLLAWLGYARRQVICYELCYIAIDAILSFLLVLLVFPYVCRGFMSLEYIGTLGKAFHIDYFVSANMYFLFFIVMTAVVLLGTMYKVQRNLIQVGV